MKTGTDVNSPSLNKKISYSELQSRIDAHPVAFPLRTNSSKSLLLARRDITEQGLEQRLNEVRPILHANLIVVMEDFLKYKTIYGSPIEKELYKSMSVTQFIDRLLKNRPFAFFSTSDKYLLRDGTTGSGGFYSVGSEEETQIKLKDYLSYDEMQLSAMISVSTPSFFLNRGERDNCDQAGFPKSFQPSGVITGIVGARFEKSNKMEYQHMLITKEQNTLENGYGANGHAKPKAALAHWAKFYGQGKNHDPYFPSFSEAQHDISGKYIWLTSKNCYLNAEVYKQRLRASIEPFLIDANDRAKQEKLPAFVDCTGIGLGAWGISVKEQTWLQLQVYADIFADNPLESIAAINLYRFPDIAEDMWRQLEDEHCKNKKPNVEFISRNPADKLEAPYNNHLLILAYAWDGNSYPGNEWWLGQNHFKSSGDPIAACFSQIAEFQNPLVNPNVCGQSTKVAKPGKDLINIAEALPKLQHKLADL